MPRQVMRRGAQAEVLRYMHEHPRADLLLDEVLIGMNRGGSTIARPQVSNAIAKLAEKGLLVKVRHMTYRYDPDVNPPESNSTVAPSVSEVYEAVGEMKDGTILLRSSSGDFYRATPL